jgi:hypothetical protein
MEEGSMSRDPKPPSETTATPTTDDVEGHALPLVVGVSEMGRAKASAKKTSDEPLPSLTKKFPSLREDTKRG